MLIPAKPETAYFQDYCFKGAGVLWLRSRVKFVGMEDGAPFPSALVFFSKNSLEEQFNQLYESNNLGTLQDFQTGAMYLSNK